jgi:hypothetical protein
MLLAPEIVASETDPIKFWRCEHGDAWAAGLRLVNNWSFRRKVFGEKRWLLPTSMNKGSLEPEDIMLLRTGAFTLRTPSDPTYRQTGVFDFGRVGQTPGSRNRGMFYYMVSELNAFTQWNGMDGIVIINGNGMKMQPDNGTLVNASNNSLMAKMHKIALVCDPNDNRMTLTHIFGSMMMKLVKQFFSGKLVMIMEATPEATRDALVAEGFHPSVIPKELGGDVSTDDFVREWILKRLLVEGLVEPSGTMAITGEKQPPSTLQAVPVERPNKTAAPIERPTKTAKRPPGRPNSKSPSAKAAGSLVVAAAVQEGSSRCSSINHQPKRSATEASLGGSAAGQPNQLETDGASVQQMRERNAQYSKSFYYRRKKAKNMLQEKHDVLVEDNIRLRDEEQRLLFLLRESQRTVMVHGYTQAGAVGYFPGWFR